MKKCSYCAEEIQDEAKKCKHCGEWIDKVNKNIPKSPDSRKYKKRSLFKKFILIFVVPICITALFIIYAAYYIPETKSSNQNTSTQKSSGNNDSYFAGYKLGSALASRHYTYKGSAYIERECNGLINNYLGSSSGGDYMFIQGCINGYKEAFGKR